VDQTVDAAPQRTYTIEFGGPLGETNVGDITVTDSTTGGTGVTVTVTTAGAANTALTLVPILPTHVCIYAFDSAQATINTTTNETETYLLHRVMEVQWSMGNRFNPLYVLNCASTGIQAMIEQLPTAQFRIRMAADAEGMGMLSNLRTGASKWFRIKATGATISSAEEYQLIIDLAGKLTDQPSDFSDQDGVYATEWQFDLTPGLTNGGAVEVGVVTSVTAL
jgi:hypothetical protein